MNTKQRNRNERTEQREREREREHARAIVDARLEHALNVQRERAGERVLDAIAQRERGNQ